MKSLFPNLDEQMRLKGVSITELADLLQLSRSTIYQRLNGQSDWRLVEIVAICQFLEYSDALKLFLQLHTN